MKEGPVFRPRPMLDLTFKSIFGREENKALLLSLLNSVLERPGFVALEEVEIQNPALDYETLGEKHPVLDVRARDGKGRVFNVEVQVAEQKTFPQRLLYYWSKMYAHQLMEGRSYDSLRPTISVAFLDYALDEQDGYARRVVLWDETHRTIFNEHLEMVLFELPKFSLLGSLEVPARRERWLYFLKETDAMTSELLERWKMPEIEHAVRELERLGRDPEWRMMYMDREKALRDYLSLIAERYEEGIEKGREEEKQEVALRLIRMGLGAEQILKVTGLSAEAMAKLQAQSMVESLAIKEEG